MIRQFNEISNWVSTSIVSSQKIRQRVKVMTKFIRLADVHLLPLSTFAFPLPSYDAMCHTSRGDQILRKMNNFNTMVAIVAGINAAPVHRLKWTKEEVRIRSSLVT